MMMKAEEFRVGNFLNYDTSEGHELTVLDWQDIRQASVENGYFNQYYSAIPLTEEWLLKFGFKRHHEDYFNNVIYIKDVVGKLKFEWGVYPKGIGSGFIVKDCVLLEQVHQLQNLFFSLTGQELTIKEP